jgi:hypothetical protein
MPLFDEKGQRIRGKENQAAAETALAKVKVATDSDSTGTTGRPRWLVAKVCSEYLQYCERGVANNTLSKGHRDNRAEETGWPSSSGVLRGSTHLLKEDASVWTTGCRPQLWYATSVPSNVLSARSRDSDRQGDSR